MSTPIEDRPLMLETRPRRGPGSGQRPRFRESLDTLILGVLSASIGTVLLIALFSGVVRPPIPGRNERAISASALYYNPSKDCAILALIGEGLGLAGLLLARYRHGTISPLSALGTALCLLHIDLFFLHVSVMELF
jgi:hypothetical protein